MNVEMRIFTQQALAAYCREYPEARVALQNWKVIVKRSKWNSFADVKKTFRTVDYIGNQRYVFYLKGNDFRLVAVIKYTIGFVYIRFVGRHEDYEKIDCLTV